MSSRPSGLTSEHATAASTCSVSVTSHSVIRTSHPGMSAQDLRHALFEDFAATGGERDADATFTAEHGSRSHARCRYHPR